jgi:hypothetical protein
MESDVPRPHRPWNKGILVGQKRPLQPKNVWSIRVRLEMSGATRDTLQRHIGSLGGTRCTCQRKHRPYRKSDHRFTSIRMQCLIVCRFF